MSVQVAPEMVGAVRPGFGGDLLGTGQDRTSLSGATQGAMSPSVPPGRDGFAQITQGP